MIDWYGAHLKPALSKDTWLGIVMQLLYMSLFSPLRIVTEAGAGGLSIVYSQNKKKVGICGPMCSLNKAINCCISSVVVSLFSDNSWDKKQLP